MMLPDGNWQLINNHFHWDCPEYAATWSLFVGFCVFWWPFCAFVVLLYHHCVIILIIIVLYRSILSFPECNLNAFGRDWQETSVERRPKWSDMKHFLFSVNAAPKLFVCFCFSSIFRLPACLRGAQRSSAVQHFYKRHIYSYFTMTQTPSSSMFPQDHRLLRRRCVAL